MGACTSVNDGDRTKDERVVDSVLLYYNISKDKSLSLKERQSAINKSFQELEGLATDSLYGYVLDQKSMLHFSSREYDSLLDYSNLLLSHGFKIDKASLLAEHYYLRGYYFAEIKHDYFKAVENYSKSKEYYIRVKDSSQAGENLMNIGIIQKNSNDFFGSKETLTDALRFLKSPIKRANCYNALATNHRKLLNFTDAIDYYQKAISITESVNNRIIYENNLAASYIDNKEFDKAIVLLQKIGKDSTATINQKEYARIKDNLAYAKWVSGLPVDDYELMEPLRLRIEKKDRRGQIASYTHLGEYYSKDNPRKARSYFDSVMQLSKFLKIPRAEKDVLKLLMELEPANVKVRDRYAFLQDSLYDQELKVKTQFAKYRYDDKLKQESILQLEKENAERQLEVAEQRNQKIISYSGLAFVLVISVCGVFFFIQRARRLKQQNRTAKIEATYETEAEFSRKLHDDFAGKLNHAMVLLQNGSDTTEVLNVVDGLYSQSRDFSRKINDVDTGSRFKEVLFGMLSSYGKNTQLLVTGSKEVDWGILSDLTKKTLYKVLQEFMINMQKHSGASVVSIDFEQTKTKLKIQYVDNGNGAAKGSLNNKNGLWNTEKRILAINGSLTFDSEKGEGFKAQVEIPN
ncbi:tetratricopeptide repeat protein [Zobellia roscoffensis]|uniref:tetratricopeptide repeat-containing sensor histidine kinase n=1 Tax=Zobellia roscoffensis TaxID=2779508 RepID=UPI00188CCC14|nr:tetratricopeptide repeat protein [Zobellia roscoffensis]